MTNNPEDHPCLCGSGHPIGACCLQPDGKTLQVRRPEIAPPVPSTGTSMSGCYLRETFNCAPPISNEHYISAALLKALGGGTIAAHGLPWIGEEPKNLSYKNLTANILCKRHNESLSPLDDIAGKFFINISNILSGNPFQSPNPDLVLVSGQGLELWLLKLLMSLHFSGNSLADGQSTLTEFPIDMKKALAALYTGNWGARCGLYVYAPEGAAVSMNIVFQTRVLAGYSEHVVYGLLANFLGIQFALVLDDCGGAIEISPDAIARPTMLRFHTAGGVRQIALSWGERRPNESITVDLSITP